MASSGSDVALGRVGYVLEKRREADTAASVGLKM